jgi:type III secretory pathway component EscU
MAFNDCLLYQTYFLVVSTLGAADVSTLTVVSGAGVVTSGVVTSGVVVSVAFSAALLQEATIAPIANTKRIFFIFLFLFV